MKEQKLIDQPSAMEFFSRFPNEDAARDYLASGRWPDGVKCIHCGHPDVWTIRGGKLYTCKSCRKQFTVRTGTVMEDSKIPLQKWIYAMYLMTVSRKGISSVQISKEIGVTQKSAWFMAHRIREAYPACQSIGQLSGPVEADETYVGGKVANMHKSKVNRAVVGTGGKGKAIVFGMKSRNGEVRAKVIPAVNSRELHAVIRNGVVAGATLYTDEQRAYRGLTDFDRTAVNHSGGVYVKGDAHTNSIESFWAIVKRGHMGIFHQWSKRHLPRYVNEFVFKANTRELPAFDRDGKDCGITTARAHMAGMEGRRLTYKRLTGND